jgi:hypothetical protein
MTCAMAQKDHSVAKDTQKNQVQLTLTDGAEKYYNTDDVQKIKFEEKQVKVVQPAGDDVYDNKVQDIAFFKAKKPAGPTKADLIGTWEVRAQEENGEESFSITFTEDQLTVAEYGQVQYVAPYTFEDGVLTYTVPATEWDDPYTETKNVSLLCDKSVIVLKSQPYEGSDIEEAEVWIKKDKSPDTSDAKLDGKWFCYHRGSKDEVRCGLFINGDKAEFIIGAWATRMVGPYTYENGVLTLHPTEYYFGRDRDDWGYGRIDPATLECSNWEKVSKNPGLIEELTGGGGAYPETFMFILNGDEAYSWYANMPCLYYKQ